jgi:hypothetical protein
MFPLSPLASHLLMLTLLLLIAGPLIVAYIVGRRRAKKAAAKTEHLAIVTELHPRPVPTERHLVAVPELREVEISRRRHQATKTKASPSTPIYDWATQGV